MQVEVLNYIEVENLEGYWAVELKECKKEMKPVTPKFIFVHNDLINDVVFVDNLLTDTFPERIIDGVNGGIATTYIEVGFWRVKNSQ